MTYLKIIVLAFILNSNQLTKLSIVKNETSKDQINNISFIKTFHGKYPSQIKLFNNKGLKRRLKELLKKRYSLLVQKWAVETPIEIKNNIFSAWGCQEHNCSNTNFIIVVDFSKNVIYVGIREEEKVKIYSEDGSSNVQISSWAKRIN